MAAEEEAVKVMDSLENVRDLRSPEERLRRYSDERGMSLSTGGYAGRLLARSSKSAECTVSGTHTVDRLRTPQAEAVSGFPAGTRSC
jgi:hypothetical protein